MSSMTTPRPPAGSEARPDPGSAPPEASRGRAQRWSSTRKALTGLALCVLTLGLITSAAALHLYVTLMGEIDRIDGAFAGLESRPARPTGGTAAQAVNILLLGTDRRSEDSTTGSSATAPAWVPGAQRTDTVMVLHIDGDRRGASVISIPRDSWVEVPGHGEAKINAAFSYAGPALAVETVERLTGLRMDHLAVIDWEGLRKLTDEAGGVNVRVSSEAYDSARKVRWAPGEHHLDGDSALNYVRQRYGLPNGDLDRVRRQHAFLRSLSRATLQAGMRTSPQQVYDLLDILTQHVSVEADWDREDIAKLVLSLRHVDTADVDYLTVPVAGFGTETGQSVVNLDARAARGLWAAVRADEVDDWVAANPDWRTPGSVR